MVRSGRVGLLVLIAMISVAIKADDNICKSWRAPSQPIRGACGDRTLPHDKIRLLHGSAQLTCTGGSNHYFRTAESMDPEKFKQWRNLQSEAEENPKANEIRAKMQALRLNEVEWSGKIPYETIEEWTWEECVHGYSFSCPWHTRRVKKHHSEPQYNSKGEYVGTREWDTEEDERYQPPCWHDEDRHEARHCTNEVLNYHVYFEHDSSWAPGKNPAYLDVLPNKYDLLPGEYEDVQVFSNSSRSTQVKPSVEIGDPWNKYQTSVQFKERTNICAMNTNYHVEIPVRTIERIKRIGPNTFREPVDEYGRPKKMVEFAVNADHQDGMYPFRMSLMDASAVIIATMANQTRQFDPELAKAQMESGQLTNSTPKEVQVAKKQAAAGFFKNTNVMIELWEVNRFARDRYISEPMHLTEVDAALGDVSGTHYTITLDGSTEKDSIYRSTGVWVLPKHFFDNIRLFLKPHHKYEFWISMKQEGVPFYDSNQFSKPLVVPFETFSYDGRSGRQKRNDWLDLPVWDQLLVLFGSER